MTAGSLDARPRGFRNGSRIRVLFVVPSLVNEGAQTQVVNLIIGLDDERFEKHLMTFCDESRLAQATRLRGEGVDFVNVGRRYKLDLAPAQRIASLVDKHQIDIVHCSLQISALFGALGIRWARRKPALLIALHTTKNRGLKDEMFDRSIYQWVLRQAARVVFVSRMQQDYWRAKFPHLAAKSTTVFNGVDCRHFDPERFRTPRGAARRELGIAEDAGVICCLAGLRREKGHHILLRAFESVQSVLPDAVLLLAGSGERRSRIERQVVQREMRDSVRLLGSVADVRPLLAASDVSVLASTAVETFSMAVLESMAMGVPVVGTDVGGMAEAVATGETGFVVPPEDSEALAHALVQVLSNPLTARCMGSLGRARVMARFSRESMIDRTADVLQELVATTTGLRAGRSHVL